MDKKRNYMMTRIWILLDIAFRRAGNPEKKNVNLHLSKEILEKIKEEKE